MDKPGSNAVRDKLLVYIREMNDYDGEIEDDTEILKLGMDSLGLVKLFVFIEQEFGLALINAGLTRNELASFGALVTAVENRIEEAGNR